jgi:hypothetical protein
MKTLLRILERAGGYRPALYLKMENPPYMAFVIEATPEPGPLNQPSISVAHYREQYSRYRDGENYVFLPGLYAQHEQFARQWDKNLRAQGFLDAFTDKSIRG